MKKKYISYIFVLLILLLHNHIYPQNNKLQNQLRLARSFEAGGKLAAAEKIYMTLHHIQPKNHQFYSSLYKILIKQKKYNFALTHTQNQIKLNSKNISLYGDLGSTYFLLGNEKKALSIWDESLKIEPDNAFAYRSIANYLIDNRLIEKSLEVLNKGNAVADDKTIFSYDIANLYSLTMKYENATKEYCKILIQKPKQLNLIQNRIIGYINSNKATEPTLKTVEDIYEDEENIIILKLLAELYLKTNNIEKAFNSKINIDKKTTQNGSVLFAFAQKASRLGAHKISAEVYTKIINDYPKSALYSEAEFGYTRSLEANLKSTTIERNSWKPFIIKEKTNENEYKNLIKAYQKLAEKYKKNKIGWQAEFRMAQIYLQNLNQIEKSDSIFNKIVNEHKSFTYVDESYFGLAQIAIKMNDPKLAETHLLEIKNSRMAKPAVKSKAVFLHAKIKMWLGEFSESINLLNTVIENPKDINANESLQYSLILNTFKNDSISLFSFSNADYLVEKGEYKNGAIEFKKLADNKNLFLLKDFAALNYIELIIALNKYREAVIFLEEVSNCDEVNIYGDRFLYLLGLSYYYGLENSDKAVIVLNDFFEKYPTSIYINKVRKIISEINAGARKNI